MGKLGNYRKRVGRFDEKKFYREYEKVSRRIEKYQRRIEVLRGERGVGLIRFLWRNAKREERLEKRMSRTLRIQKTKLNILEKRIGYVFNHILGS